MVDHTFTLTNALNYMLKRIFNSVIRCLYVATYNAMFFPGRYVNRVVYLPMFICFCIYVGEGCCISIASFKLFFVVTSRPFTHP